MRYKCLITLCFALIQGTGLLFAAHPKLARDLTGLNPDSEIDVTRTKAASGVSSPESISIAIHGEN